MRYELTGGGAKVSFIGADGSRSHVCDVGDTMGVAYLDQAGLVAHGALPYVDAKVEAMNAAFERAGLALSVRVDVFEAGEEAVYGLNDLIERAGPKAFDAFAAQMRSLPPAP